MQPERISRTLRRSVFSPTWLPAPWNKPLVGYVCAVCLPCAMIVLTRLILLHFPTFALKGIFAQSTTLVVALLWGIGPGLLATLLSAILLNVVLLPPVFALSIDTPQALLETGVFLAFGLAICLVVSRIEYARNEAEQARQRSELLARQLEQEQLQAANRASELEAVFAAITDGVYVYDAQGHVKRANPAGEALNPFINQHDYRQQPFLERITSFLPRDPEGQELTQENIPVLRALRGEVLTGEQAVDTLMRTVEGEELLHNVTGAPILNEAGDIQGAVIVMRDVTARRQLEQESAARAVQLQILFEAVPDAITVFDREGRIVQMNESAQHLLGRYTTLTQEPAGQRMRAVGPQDLSGTLITEETSATFRLLRGETLTGARAQDVTVKTFDGEQLWLSVAGAPLYDKEGNVDGAVAVIRDLTEQYRSNRRTWQALQALLHFAEALVQAGTTQEAVTGEVQQEQQEAGAEIDQVASRLATLMSQVLAYPHVSLTTLKENTHEAAARATVGLRAEQERGWRARRQGYTLYELIAGTDDETRLNAGEAVIIDLDTPHFSALRAAYGPAKFLLVPMFLEGREVGIVTFDAGDAAHEYSDEEVSLARALAQLAALTLERTRLFQERAQAQATVLALSEANHLMDEFIGIAGHELRTPLTTIQGSVQLARRQVNKILKQRESLLPTMAPLVTSVGDHLERTERQIRMQNRLISDLLDVARVHADRLELHPQLCDLALLLRECVEDQRYLAPNRTITLISKDSEEILVMADTDRLWQVIGNYLSNALKYSEADKPVEVYLQPSGRVVRVAVCDEGPGLSRQEQQRIWERFYRVPGMEVRSGSGVGLGLGLHISRMIVERLGGQVGVQSAPGNGSTFWFTLPLVETAAEE